MKLLRTCVSLAVLLSMIGAPAFASEVVTVESVEATAEDTVMVMTATDLALADGEVTGDVKLFQDVNVVSATTDAEDATKLTLALGSDLEANTTYNLLSVFGVDGGIDFSL
ncbi:MAG: hypothetical protein H6767_04280 [Candidatus Peribacteria bacterium]|nr:MAG: hypothetical protein H6767_04280 [Candidatus Peribacteria bacterium]